jgi:hypothetical protein
MSVLMLLRVKGDPVALEKYAASNLEKIRTISSRGKAAGATRHRFFGTDNEIIVVDEWPDEASFQKFFDSSPDIQELMAQVGVTSAPEITFARALDVDHVIG